MKEKQLLLAQIMTALAQKESAKADILVAKFLETVSEITSDEITQVAQKLEVDGVFADASQHISIEQRVFKIIQSKVPKEDIYSYEEGHPVHTFLAENKIINEWVDRAGELLTVEDSFVNLKSDWILMAKQFSSLHIHYLRKENQLFPFLERYGFNHPSTMMWSLHDEIRRIAKLFAKAVADNDEVFSRELLAEVGREAYEMTVKEERVLLPKLVSLLNENDWKEIRDGEEEIGWIVPTPPTWNPYWKHPSQLGGDSVHPHTVSIGESSSAEPIPFDTSQKKTSYVGGLNLGTGSITPEQINLIFKHLPFDVTYVDEFDEVRFYNKGDNRVFPRSPGIIGRQVKHCHPPKSVHMVERIVAAFKSGERSESSFWINFHDKFIHIQYFAVRDDAGNYKGVIEITQDATAVRSLEGEQRLLDWE